MNDSVIIKLLFVQFIYSNKKLASVQNYANICFKAIFNHYTSKNVGTVIWAYCVSKAYYNRLEWFDKEDNIDY